ncbi:hypothetical protein AMS68_004395 [Peltaster fructicola]|uniref:PQ loop repeat protein n=1 Tax=Peltaster fructicola TaxID=286661 RepID=A0A6H0XWA0_9PEZI|nr:hypothetical protein AMS68_004395 [Peltaster fructicola]
MMMLWAWAGVPLGVYNIVSNFNVALLVQPQILTCLSLITWTQCYYYEHKWSVGRCVATAAPIAVLMGGVQVALIFALQASTRQHIEWPLTLMAVLAALFLALGVLRHYLDIWRHKTVRGISFLFVGLDALGDLTSLLSLLFQPKVDVQGLAIYGVEFVLWLGIFACGGYFNLIPWVKSRLETRRSEAVQDSQIAMHDLPSSTSVFRTVSNDHASLRSRITILMLSKPLQQHRSITPTSGMLAVMSGGLVTQHGDEVSSTALTSGDTSPIDDTTISTDRRRSPSLDTLPTEVTVNTFSDGSGGLALPAAPVNSPEAQSVVGDCGSSSNTETLNTAILAERLHAMPSLLTSPRGNLVKRNVDQAESTAKADVMKQHIYEHSSWAEIAEEDVVRALARMAMLAKDEHKENNFKQPVSHYYSTRMARLLRAGEIEFDSKYLQ